MQEKEEGTKRKEKKESRKREKWEKQEQIKNQKRNDFNLFHMEDGGDEKRNQNGSGRNLCSLSVTISHSLRNKMNLV